MLTFLNTLCFTGEELHARIGVCPQQYVAVGELTIREQVRRFLDSEGIRKSLDPRRMYV